MKIILLRKSQLTTDREFYISEGSTITENYNETLDSANIRISHITEHLDIEPFDRVILRDEEGRLADRYMCVDTYTETMESIDPYIYSYEISLFSQTKELENIILPSLSITRRPDGIEISVFEYISRYFEMYEPQVMTALDDTGESYEVKGRYRFLWESTPQHPSLYDKFASVICPEMQWNNPTLREVITDLMMVVDCIPVVRNNVIDYIDLSQKKDLVDTSKVNYIQRSQSAEDYVSELKMTMQNVMQTAIQGVDNTCNRVEWLTFTTDGYVVTDENIVLKTQYPINNIKHLWMLLPSCYDRYERFLKFDLCNVNNTGNSFLYEKTVYDTLPIDRTVNNYTSKTLEHVTSHMNYCIYFTRGGNTIEGFAKKWKELDLFNIQVYVLEMLGEYFQKNYFRDTTGDVHNPETEIVSLIDFSRENSWYSVFFQIEYETLASDTFQASKNIAPTHSRVVVDNQTNSYVDAYNQGFMEYQKANRLGNQQLHINARYENDYNNIIKIGDYYEDSIIFQTQYQIYKNHIEVNASATKDYILRNYFTGVKAHIRSWQLASGSDALTRNDLNKYYLEFSTKRKSNNINVYNNDLSYYFLSPFYSWEAKPLEYCFVYTATQSAGTRPENNGLRYETDLTGRIIGNSLVFTFGFNDNIEAGKKVSSEVTINQIDSGGINPSLGRYYPFQIDTGWSNNYGGILLEPLRYTDNNGEFAHIVYTFTSEFENSLGNIVQRITEEGFGNVDKSEFLLQACQSPEIPAPVNEIKFHDSKFIWKDNREITRISTQFEFCSDTNRIAFGKKFIELQESVRNIDLSRSIVIHNVQDQLGEGTGIGQTITRTVEINAKPEDVSNYSYRLVVDNLNISNQRVSVLLDVNTNNSILEFTCNLDSIIDPTQPANLDCYFSYVYYTYKANDISYNVRYKRITNPNFIDMDLTGTTRLGDGSLLTITNIANDCATVEIDTSNFDGNVEEYVFYITYEDLYGEHILLAMSGMNKVYLNCLVTRDYSIYDATGNYVINGI